MQLSVCYCNYGVTRVMKMTDQTSFEISPGAFLDTCLYQGIKYVSSFELTFHCKILKPTICSD